MDGCFISHCHMYSEIKKMSLQLVNLQLIPTKFTANNNLHFSKKTKKTKKLQLNNKQIHKKVHKLKKK